MESCAGFLGERVEILVVGQDVVKGRRNGSASDSSSEAWLKSPWPRNSSAPTTCQRFSKRDLPLAPKIRVKNKRDFCHRTLQRRAALGKGGGGGPWRHTTRRAACSASASGRQEPRAPSHWGGGGVLVSVGFSRAP